MIVFGRCTMELRYHTPAGSCSQWVEQEVWFAATAAAGSGGKVVNTHQKSQVVCSWGYRVHWHLEEVGLKIAGGSIVVELALDSTTHNIEET